MERGFRTDPEFEDHLPKISPEQYAALSVMIELDGPRPGSLVVANIRGDHVLIDGHSTFKICAAKKLRLPEPVIINFPDRQAALEWIEKNQRSRRNMTPEEIERIVAARRERVAQALQKGESTRSIAAKEKVCKNRRR